MTTTRVELVSAQESGEKHWADFRDPSELRAGDRKRIFRAIQDPGHQMAAGLELIDGLLAMLISNWSIQLPLPSARLDSIDLLEIADYDALVDAAQPARERLFPSFKGSTDPDSPTEPSAG